MSLATYLLDSLNAAMSPWPLALKTLPDTELRNQREAMRQRCEGAVGICPAALVLAAIDAEIASRRRPGELPL